MKIKKVNEHFGFLVNTETKEAVLIFSQSPCDNWSDDCSIKVQNYFIVGITKDTEHGDHLIHKSPLSGEVMMEMAKKILEDEFGPVKIWLNGDQLFDTPTANYWIYVSNQDQSNFPRW